MVGQTGPDQTRPDDCLTALYMALTTRHNHRDGVAQLNQVEGLELVLLARQLIYVRMRAALAPYSGAP